MKLQGFGLASSLLKWMEHILVDRHMMIHVNGSLPNWTAVLNGVPQA